MSVTIFIEIRFKTIFNFFSNFLCICLKTSISKKVCLVNNWEFNGNESDDDHDDDDVEMKPRKYAGSRKSEGTGTNFEAINRKGDDNEEVRFCVDKCIPYVRHSDSHTFFISS